MTFCIKRHMHSVGQLYSQFHHSQVSTVLCAQGGNCRNKPEYCCNLYCPCFSVLVKHPWLFVMTLVESSQTRLFCSRYIISPLKMWGTELEISDHAPYLSLSYLPPFMILSASSSCRFLQKLVAAFICTVLHLNIASHCDWMCSW